ncbi:MAG: hypothetical protein G8345_10335 [Magnetococcales bacterium]|nr:hypothetical protein [Magnetococcales bacterium]NGZ27269.1 hypothetical protein [Magnetococcales bacterium]
MKVLKAAVIFMGVLLVVGTTLLIMRVQEKGFATPKKSEKPMPVGQITLAPQGRVESMAPMGEGVAMLVNSPQAGQELILLDSQGEVVRRLALSPAAGR